MQVKWAAHKLLPLRDDIDQGGNTIIHIDGLHRAYRDVTHCLISIRELRHLFEPCYFSGDEMEPSQRPKWLAHFVKALAKAHGHATESWGLLRAEFAEAANSEVVLCGIKADSLHGAVVALGTRMLGYVHEFWDGDDNAPVLLPETMYGLGSAFRLVNPAELWQHTRLEQEYLKARRSKPTGRGPRTRRELAADLLSQLRRFRARSLPSAPVDTSNVFDVSDRPPPVYFDREPDQLDNGWLWSVFTPFRSCKINPEAGERFNAAAARATEAERTRNSLQRGPSSVTPPERLAAADASYQTALRKLYESLLDAVQLVGAEEADTPLAPVEYDEEWCRQLGLSREHLPLSSSEHHGNGPGQIHYAGGCGWSWGENLLPEVPEDDLQQAHRDVLQLAASFPGSDLTEGFYISSSDTDESNIHDPARMVYLIENLGYAYWRAKYRMAVVGLQFAGAADKPVMLCPSCPETAADSAHAAVVRIAELLLRRIQKAIAASTDGDEIRQDNYYTVVEAFKWSALTEFADSRCGGHWEHRGLIAEYQKAIEQQAGASDVDKRPGPGD